MLTEIVEFFITGVTVIITYCLYFVMMVVGTFLLGLPIAFGIKLILEFMKILFTSNV